MPNILQMQEILKSVPDQRLMQEMQKPTGRAPQFLVMTELQRRKKVRDEYQGRVQEEQTTVVEDMVRSAAPQQAPMPSGGMASLAPQPPMQPQAGPPPMGMAQGRSPIRAEGGGALYMQAGSTAAVNFGVADLDRLIKLVEAEAGNQGDEGKRGVAAVILNRLMSGGFPNTIKEVAEQSGQFQPLRKEGVGGNVDNLPEGGLATRSVVLELLGDFNKKNPVGNALYFQNPAISDKIHPALRKYYDSSGQRNDTEFEEGVTVIEDHTFSELYGDEKRPQLDRVAFTVDENALTTADKGRLGTDETLKLTGAGQLVSPTAEMEPSEPPVPELSVAERLRLKDPEIPVGDPISSGIGSVRKRVAENIFQPPEGMTPTDEFQQAALGAYRGGPSVAERLRPGLQAGILPVDTDQSISSGVMPQLAQVRDSAFVPPAALTSTDQFQEDASAAYQSPEQSWLEKILSVLPDLSSPGERSEVAQRLTVPRKEIPVGEKITPLSPLAQVREGMKYYEDPLVAFGGAGEDPVISTAEVKQRLADLQAPLKQAYESKEPIIKQGPFEVAEPLIAHVKKIAEESKGQITPSRIRTAPVETAQIPSTLEDPLQADKLVAAENVLIPPAPSPLDPGGASIISAASSGDGSGVELKSDVGNLAIGEGPPALAPPVPGQGGSLPSLSGAGGVKDLMAQIAAGRDDAKAMGLLTAGLGIMQQASQPGATFMSSLPGAQAGVKQYSADKANLAKQQMALATLANQQRATEIAAQRASKPDAYERYERDVLDDYRNSDDWKKYFFDDGTGKPGRVKPTVRSEIRKTYTRTLDPSLTGSRLMQTYVKYEESAAGKSRLGQIRKDLKAKGVDETTAFREAPLILRREFLSGGSAPLVKAPSNRPDIATFNKAG
tara:strand:- start:153 stop:2831 length:2679 start_codon:yes stop_codon:yes gene_type:complete